MSQDNPEVAIIGAGPKAISLLCALKKRNINAIAYETGKPVSTWNSKFAGTSPTRTGMFFSDTINPQDSLVPSLSDYCSIHIGIDTDMFARDILPKEVLQQYYADVIKGNKLKVKTHTAIKRVDVIDDTFYIHTANEEKVSAKYLIDATGIVWAKVYPEWANDIDKNRVFHSIGHGILSNVKGKKILLVGGGHATPDIASRYCELGAHVTVTIRADKLKKSLLPYPEKYLSLNFQKMFRQKTPSAREKIIYNMNNCGPWVTPRSYSEFVNLLSNNQTTDGSIRLFNTTEVVTVTQKENTIHIELSNDLKENFDYVICATGFAWNLGNETSFRFNTSKNIARINSFPILNDVYESINFRNLYFVGYQAQLGPRGPIDSILYGSQATSAIIADSILEKMYHQEAKTSNSKVGQKS